MAAPAFNQSYNYQPGESASSYINHNTLQDAKNPKTWAAGGLPIIQRAFSGRSRYNDANNNYQLYQRDVANNRNNRLLEDQQTQQNQDQLQQDQQRTGAINALDQGFNDPSRQRSREDLYGAQLGNETANLQYNYGQASHQAALQAVKRGGLGGSTDAEKQAGLQSSLQNGILSAQGAAQNSLSGLQDQDTKQYEALRRSLLSGDPQASMTYQAQAQQAGDKTQQILQSSAQEQRQRELNAQQQYNTYSAYGQAASGLGKGVYDAYGNPQYSGGY